MLEVRQATAADVIEWYEGYPPATLRAWVAVLDGRVVGIAGVAYGGLSKSRFVPEAFSEFKPELQPYLRSPQVQTAIRRVVKMIRTTRPGPIAYADSKHPGAERLLTRLGAVRIASSEQGEVYQWGL